MDAPAQMKFLALGDSYTICESVDENERWPVQLVNRLRERDMQFEDPTIIAVTGWRTDDLKRAIIRQKPDLNNDLVSLLIGVNNQYQGKDINAYADEFRELLQIAIDHAGGRKERVFVLSIPDYGFTPFGKDSRDEISPEIDKFNKVNETITREMGIAWFDITPISRKGIRTPSLVAVDGLHPSGKMYQRWVDMIFDHIIKTLQ